jgi:hypothetical protein
MYQNNLKIKNKILLRLMQVLVQNQYNNVIIIHNHHPKKITYKFFITFFNNDFIFFIFSTLFIYILFNSKFITLTLTTLPL